MSVNEDVSKSSEGQTSPNPLPRSEVNALGGISPRGDFDARVKRKKRGMTLKTLLIARGVVLTLCVAVMVIFMIAASHMSQNNKIDESRVKADDALQRVTGKDDDMDKFMRKKETKEETHIVIQPSEEPKKGAGSAVTKNSSHEILHPEAPPTIQLVLDGGIFPIVRRFQSSGLKAPDPVKSQGHRQAGKSEDADIEQINAFVHAPPAEFHSGRDQVGMSTGEGHRGRLSTLSGTGFESSKAYVMPSGQFLVAHNTYTRCALYTRIVTDQPGLIECRLTEPLYSSDGSVVIAQAGDKLTGEQKVEVRAGQTRVFTSWTELETASGVRAKLDRLGAGPMGASGTEAWIDHHYKQRFGGAVMLSFIQDALHSAANATQKSSQGYTVNNSEQNVESMAKKALENSINIPPTAYILPEHGGHHPDGTLIYQYQVLFLMDEFAVMGVIEKMKTALALTRGAGLRYLIIFQGKAQLRSDALYGFQGANGIMDAVHIEVVYAPGNIEAATEYSQRLGNTTVKVSNFSENYGEKRSRSRSSSDQARPLMLPQEVNDLPYDKALIFVQATHKTPALKMLARKIFWYEEPVFQERVNLPLPSVPAGEVNAIDSLIVPMNIHQPPVNVALAPPHDSEMDQEQQRR
ncbi:type IV secretory system conjugative DNA transfer family protein [Candidatus Williamhamiltonella defendens]|uniref:type IV secretory system conjugative DNA transfer family protein n=1 Tax=Candidatus Williamhamiltonella defendens TaxID=138072 RepID=UPI0002F96C9A|nr:TrbI/VirB10 family protein [Candidatus Hamiltonella defensa]